MIRNVHSDYLWQIETEMTTWANHESWFIYANDSFVSSSSSNFVCSHKEGFQISQWPDLTIFWDLKILRLSEIVLIFHRTTTKRFLLNITIVLIRIITFRLYNYDYSNLMWPPLLNWTFDKSWSNFSSTIARTLDTFRFPQNEIVSYSILSLLSRATSLQETGS
jgi:hypothetical protein